MLEAPGQEGRKSIDKNFLVLGLELSSKKELDQDCLQQDPKRPCLNPTLKRVGFKQEMQELPPESFVYQQTTITSQLN